MTPAVAAAVRAVVTFTGQPKTADAARVMRASMRAAGLTEDRFGNFKIDDTHRWNFGDTVLRHQWRNGQGAWTNLTSRPVIAYALVTMKKAAEVLGDAALLAQATDARAKRTETQKQNDRKRVDARTRDAARRAAAMRLASTHREQVWASLYQKELPPDLIAEMQTQMETDTEMFVAFGLPPPGTFSSLDTPPLMPVFASSYEDAWQEDGLDIGIEHHDHSSRPYASVEITRGKERLVGGEVRPPIRGIVSGPDKLSARLFSLCDECPEGVLRGALAAWCRILRGYEIKLFEVRSVLLMRRLQGFGFASRGNDFASCP